MEVENRVVQQSWRGSKGSKSSRGGLSFLVASPSTSVRRTLSFQLMARGHDSRTQLEYCAK